MSDANSLHSEIEVLRQRVIQMIEELQRKSQSFGLPSPPSSLEDHLLKLKANSYNVLVVGEAKRGKSTFVNALIGRDILPTGVAVTTSQVFLVRSAYFEAYHLRFEDNSEREIGQNNLAEYGSQVLANIKGLPSLDQIIRWIEVDIPVKYLPRGVNILDTPGLGSLYSAHAQITRRFLPLADAVIFVLDSDQTMLQSELTFIEMILDITKNIFFIQTKIDHYRPEKWQELQRRHQEVITQHFKDRLIDTRVWPISSKSLLKSMQDEDDSADYLFASKYPQLSLALQVFLFRVSGLERARAATEVAKNYCEMTKVHLSAHLANVLEQSEQKQQDLQQNIAQRTRLFDAEWGAYGRKREELLSNINNVLLMHKQLFLQELHQRGQIETSQRNKINGLKSFEEAKQYSKTLDEQLVNVFLDKWHQIYQQAQRECGDLLIPFLNAASAVSIPILISPETVVTGEVDLNARVNWDWIIEKAGQEIHFLFGVLSLVLPLPNMITTLATLFWAGIRAWSYREGARLEDAKQQLNEHLTVTLQTIMQSFVDAASGGKNRVDVYFDALRSTMLEQVQKIATQKSLEAQKELDHLSKEATLNGQQRKIRAEQLQQQLTEWDGIYQATGRLKTELENMDRLLSVLSTYPRN